MSQNDKNDWDVNMIGITLAVIIGLMFFIAILIDDSPTRRVFSDTLSSL